MNSYVAETKKFINICVHMVKIAVSIRPMAVLINLAGALLETIASIVTIYAGAKLTALVAHFIATGNKGDIWLWLWVTIAAALGSSLGFWLMRYGERLLYFAINRWAVDTFLAAINRIDIAEFYDDEIRNRINKVGDAYAWQIPNLSAMVFELIYGLVRFMVIAVLVAQISWWLIVVTILFLVPTLLSDNKISQISWLVWGDKGDNRHIFSKLNAMMHMPQNQMEIRSMQSRDYLLEKVHTINTDFYNTQEHKFRRASRLSISAKTLEVGGFALGSIVLLRQLLNGSLGLDRYFFLSGALSRIGGSLNAIFGTLSRIQDPLQFCEDFFLLLDTQPHIVDPPKAKKLVTKQAPEITFQNVSFTYPGQTKATFTNLSFTIRSGEHIALVGENGAGKSTIIKLLMRYYVPDSGSILINGQDLSAIQIESWYEQLATLFQNFNDYPFPIDENIYVSLPSEKADRKRLDQAATFGGVDKLVKSYKYGWDTVLDSSFKKGIEPSGGQWQRVALARAFYRQANMIILDEPTSAIDAKAEYDIFNNIFDHYQNKTALIVSHRFSTVRRANRIIVLEHGQVIEEGSHKELLKKKGLYFDMFTKQAEGYR